MDAVILAGIRRENPGWAAQIEAREAWINGWLEESKRRHGEDFTFSETFAATLAVGFDAGWQAGRRWGARTADAARLNAIHDSLGLLPEPDWS